MRDDVSIVVPAFNEERLPAATLAEHPRGGGRLRRRADGPTS